MIVDSEDKAFISKVLEYARTLKKQKTVDSTEELPQHIIDELVLSMNELDNGTDAGIPHSVMLEKLRKEYPSLNI